MNLGEFAGACRDLAARCEAGLARSACTEGALDYLAILRHVTPKRTGRLAASETIDSITGGGALAVAVAGPHTVYAEFRNDGGSITKHGPGSLGNPDVGWFGHTVTQAGAHYMEKADALARGPVAAACQAALDRMLVL